MNYPLAVELIEKEITKVDGTILWMTADIASDYSKEKLVKQKELLKFEERLANLQSELETLKQLT